MSGIITRLSREPDSPALRFIWRTVFGKADEDLFFGFDFSDSLCIIAEHDHIPAGAGYLLPAGNLLYGGASVPCAMIYGVAVLPEHRNHGIGINVVNELIKAGWDAGYTAIVTCPSEDSLFGYYKAHAGFNDWFYTTEEIYTKVPDTVGQSRITESPPGEYAQLRERLLEVTPHIEVTPGFLDYQKVLSREYGGGLFRIDTLYGVCCAIVERQPDSSVWVKELLYPDTTENAWSETDFAADKDLTITANAKNAVLSAIASVIPSSRTIVRSPVRHSTNKALIRRFGMLTAQADMCGSDGAETALPWYGPAFD